MICLVRTCKLDRSYKHADCIALCAWHAILGAITFLPCGLEVPIVASAMRNICSVCVQANSMTEEVQSLHGKFLSNIIWLPLCWPVTISANLLKAAEQ